MRNMSFPISFSICALLLNLIILFSAAGLFVSIYSAPDKVLAAPIAIALLVGGYMNLLVMQTRILFFFSTFRSMFPAHASFFIDVLLWVLILANTFIVVLVIP